MLGLIAAIELTLCFVMTVFFDEIEENEGHQEGRGGRVVENCCGSSVAFGFSTSIAASM